MVIIALAGFGFVFRLITEPMGLLNQIFVMAIMIAILYAIYKLFLQKRLGQMGGSAGNSKYQKAVKQSQRKYKMQPKRIAATKRKTKLKNKPLRPIANKHKKRHNFTVIEGKKGKKKNRASF